jgi:hypothetical protein
MPGERGAGLAWFWLCRQRGWYLQQRTRWLKRLLMANISGDHRYGAHA